MPHKKNVRTRKQKRSDVSVVHPSKQTRTGQKIHYPHAFPWIPHPVVQGALIPGSDFYQHINKRWLKTAYIPRFRVSYGVSEEVEEKIKTQFFSFLDSILKNTSLLRDPIKRSVQLLCKSAFRPAVQENSVNLLRQMIYSIDCIRDTSDIARTMGEFTYYRIPTLFSLFAWFESGHPAKVRFALGTGTLGLPDSSYYLLTAPGKTKTVRAYGTMLDKLVTELGLTGVRFSDGVPIETQFAEALAESDMDDEMILKGSKLPTRYPHIPWKTFWEGARFSKWRSSSLKIMSPSWCAAINRAFHILSVEDWKLLFKLQFLLHAAPLLPPPFDDIHFQFFDKQLRGQIAKRSQRELVLYLLQEWMTDSMSAVYRRMFIPPHMKTNVEQFVEKIRAATLHRIEQTEWLTPATRKKSIHKVTKMLLGVAYPETPRALSLPPLDSDNLLQNVLTLAAKRTENDIQLINTVYNAEKSWDDAIYAVNAYYYSEINQLILPAGTLQWPFFDNRAPIGWNYGALGVIVGHEITHAFDRDGRMYDEYGVRGGDNWTAEDNREYTKRTVALVKLFDSARISGTHRVNGENTLDENIADLGGMAVALDALNTELGAAGDVERKTAYKHFFQAYAVSWRTKEKPAKVLQGLFMDSHAPAQCRVNLIVSQFEEWYQAYDIDATAPLYIPPEERIRIF